MNKYTVVITKTETCTVNVTAEDAEQAMEIVDEAIMSGLTASDFYEENVETSDIDVETQDFTQGYGVPDLPEEWAEDEVLA